ncbi:MAG: preprotein translocase subunit SecA [Candidatus Omnitrophica bacterium]|nr:preprotein translocase subunit SecA [Candidatus Omnitrophota bacterium]
MQPLVDKINALEGDMKNKSDSGLREMTDEFKRRLEKGETLEALLPEAFAVVREAATRVIGMRHFDVQLMGGMALFEGNIAEMATGEGKTLVATLPSYLIALEGRGVHVVTVNDYLAKRDMEWMGPIHEFLGLTIGAIQHDQDPKEKHAAYRADITYGTNNEFGFDYLRSNLTPNPEDRPQRELHYAIVDEVDSILIDEARTPLIISGPADLSPETYYQVNQVIPRLRREQDFTVDEKERNVLLTDDGMEHAQNLLGLDNMFSEENLDIVHYLDQALKAHFLFEKDVHYVVQDGQVVIVDEFTGRLMPGRRWSDGLHQAVEAKEGVKIERENQTLATITFQNYFRMYNRLAGMTGTADTEAGEFREIYDLDVVVVPTNKPIIRKDLPDQVYRSEREKFEAIVSTIVDRHLNHQPALVGTVSIEKSEHLSDLMKNRPYWRKRMKEWIQRIKEEAPKSKLDSGQTGELDSFLSRKEALTADEVQEWVEKIAKANDETLAYLVSRLGETVQIIETMQRGLEFNVLNAKFHQREAEIVAQAGRPGAITIATNMAGRGTDIVLGGNAEKMIEDELAKLPEDTPEDQIKKIKDRIHEECRKGREIVLEAGGLMIIGTERHESRRIDNQLRGRSGRQGDPGVSRFYLSLEDDLMRLFGGERMKKVAERLGMEDGEVIEAKLVTRSIRKAQKKVEDRNFEIRKYVIKYDDVMNKQREVIYKLRNDLLEGENPEEPFMEMAWNVFDDTSQTFIDRKTPPDEWDIDKIQSNFANFFNLKPEVELGEGVNLDQQIENLERSIWKRIEEWYQERKEQAPNEEEWRHLMRHVMLWTVDTKWKDHLLTMDHLKDSINLRGYAGKDPQQEYQKEGFALFQRMYANLEQEIVARMFRVELVKDEGPTNRRARRMLPRSQGAPRTGPIVTRKREVKKVGRNDPCPCGSGKKYKKCCMNKEVGV